MLKLVEPSPPNSDPRQALAYHVKLIAQQSSKLHRLDQAARRAAQAMQRENDVRKALDNHAKLERDEYQRWLDTPHQGEAPAPDHGTRRMLADAARAARDDRLAADAQSAQVASAYAETAAELERLKKAAAPLIAQVLRIEADRYVQKLASLRHETALTRASIEGAAAELQRLGDSAGAEDLRLFIRGKKRIATSINSTINPTPPNPTNAAPASDDNGDAMYNSAQRLKEDRESRHRDAAGNAVWNSVAPIGAAPQSTLVDIVDAFDQSEMRELQELCALERGRWSMLSQYYSMGRITATIATVIHEENI